MLSNDSCLSIDSTNNNNNNRNSLYLQNSIQSWCKLVCFFSFHSGHSVTKQKFFFARLFPFFISLFSHTKHFSINNVYGIFVYVVWTNLWMLFGKKNILKINFFFSSSSLFFWVGYCFFFLVVNSSIWLNK